MTFFFNLVLLVHLNENTKPLWGKMTPQHMVEHLVQAVQLCNGKIINTDCMNPDEKLPVLKRFLMSDRPMPRNFVNTVIGAELKPLIFGSLDEAKSELRLEINLIEDYFSANPNSKPINPTFGPLNKEEWYQFHKKHFTHHFTQFGLIRD